MAERKIPQPPTLLDDKQEPDAQLAATAETSASIFERFAKDPAVDVEKFERFMAMYERERARQSEADFDAAMNLAQQEMEPVRKDAYNSQTNSKYASFEKLDAAVRPIYTKHGFGLSFDTGDAPHPDEVRMLCYVSHKGGHKRPYKLDLPADGKGAKGGDVMTRTHATVSATSYGQRVLLRLIFNIAVGGDDDGNKAGRVAAPRPPTAQPKPVDGLTFETWWKAVSETATRGVAAFNPAWECSPPVFKNYALQTDRDGVNALKATARAAAKGKP